MSDQFMAKAVFTTKVNPSYKDLPEQRYHFPRTYLNYVQQTVGDYIVYYEPRRSSAELSSRGGRQSYFGVARVESVIKDEGLADHFFAIIDGSTYLDFDAPVPFLEGNKYYESALEKDDGSTNKGAFGRAVRLIPDVEFDLILRAGFSPVLSEEQSVETRIRDEVDESQVEFKRPLVEMTISRPFRDRAFKFAVRAAYDNRCALTGLRLINGGGRPEVEAAHIRPVAADGPDTVRNGLALSGTVHWMFDRGLISIGDDYKILVAKDRVPDNALRLLNESRIANLPKDVTLYPNAHYLKFHRDNVFKG
jgi:putative restriction endonuclease